jgi:hypothetical protein
MLSVRIVHFEVWRTWRAVLPPGKYLRKRVLRVSDRKRPERVHRHWSGLPRNSRGLWRPGFLRYLRRAWTEVLPDSAAEFSSCLLFRSVHSVPRTTIFHGAVGTHLQSLRAGGAAMLSGTSTLPKRLDL